MPAGKPPQGDRCKRRGHLARSLEVLRATCDEVHLHLDVDAHDAALAVEDLVCLAVDALLILLGQVARLLSLSGA
jgi:hypothetical protein